MAIKLIDGSEFLHIPKTGGQWVTKVLRENKLIEHSHLGGHEHADYDRVLNNKRLGSGKELLRECIRISLRKYIKTSGKDEDDSKSQPFRFCFVRHPLSWYESWWKYMSSRNWNYWGVRNSAINWHPNSTLNGLGSDDFNQFIRNVINCRPGYVSELYFSFTKPGINFIGKTEHLKDDLLTVLNVLNLTFDRNSVDETPRQNVSPASSDNIIWDPELRKTVTLLELPALVHFGYLTSDEAQKIGFPESIKIKPNEALQKVKL